MTVAVTQAPIDFVIAWVDGSDLAWLKQKNHYLALQTGQPEALDVGVQRYRDWDNLKYWFRAVEKYAPWVNRVHFITWGHLPPWLDPTCPKLHIVRHEDYLPLEYRPTFNANTIELNLHRLDGLSEQFVYFNDDMYLLRPMTESNFFFEGLPCTYGAEVPFSVTGEPGIWQHLIVNDLRTINTHFHKPAQIQRNARKYRNSGYGLKTNIRTIALEKLFPENFLGFQNLHAPAAFLKRTFEEIWRIEPKLLHETSEHHFRTSDDVNQWLMLWWQIAEGNFQPHIVDNLVDDVTENSIERLCNIIAMQKHDMICLNDPAEDEIGRAHV